MPKPNIKNILVRVPNWIGDAVLCLPAIGMLKTLYPKAEISVLARPWVSPLFFHNPAVKHILQYDSLGRHKGVRGKRKLIHDIKRHGFDMAVLFQNAFDAALIAFLSRIPIRTGYNRDLRRMLLTHPLPLTEETRKAHQVFYYLHVIASLIHSRDLGVDNSRSKKRFTLHHSLRLLDALLLIEDTGCRLKKWIHPSLYLPEEEKKWAKKFVKARGVDGGMVIGVAPGASYGPAKRWMPDKFASVAQRLAQTYDATIILFGGKDDREICENIIQTTGGLNLAGETDLRQSIALFDQCSLFLTNDSGPMHIAASLGVPTVAIFGSTDPTLTGPLGATIQVIKKDVPCSPCFKRECREGHYNCMKMITQDEVYEASAQILDKWTKVQNIT